MTDKPNDTRKHTDADLRAAATRAEEAILNAKPTVEIKTGIAGHGAGRVHLTITVSGGDFDKVQALGVRLATAVLDELPGLSGDPQ